MIWKKFSRTQLTFHGQFSRFFHGWKKIFTYGNPKSSKIFTEEILIFTGKTKKLNLFACRFAILKFPQNLGKIDDRTSMHLSIKTSIRTNRTVPVFVCAFLSHDPDVESGVFLGDISPSC